MVLLKLFFFRCLISQYFFAEFGRTLANIFLELLVEVVYVLISDLLGYLVDLHLVLGQKLFGVVDSYMVYVGIEAFTHSLIENLAQVSTVVAKERRDGLQLDIGYEVVIDVVHDIIQHAVAIRIADGTHNHLELLREILNNLIEIVLGLDEL